MKRTVTLKISEEILSMVDELVASGKYKSRSHVIAKALEDFVVKERFAVSYLPAFPKSGGSAEEAT
ncbi:MAG: ribbon-helix-helix domain-containing protein [Desulfurococcales archaeon]